MKLSYSALLSLFYLTNFAIAHGGDHAADETPGSGGDYVVLIEQSDPRTVEEFLVELGAQDDIIKRIYNNTAFKGFAGTMSKHCVDKLGVMSGIKHYQKEQTLWASEITTQTDATWGLERISSGGTIDVAGRDQLDLGFSYTFDDEPAGQGVDIYVVDTGVKVDHIDFNGRATFGWAFDEREVDENGHGTHCAGTAASSTLGVAKNANIIAVKVLGADGSGATGAIVAGLDFVINEHTRKRDQPGFAGSVISMSLGSDAISKDIDDAVELAASQGIHVSVAAGNAAVDACNTSPALASKSSTVISVGAIDIDDSRASFSNFGECVTTYGPGVGVVSTFIDPRDPINGANFIINDLQGTSMACPHISGLIAYFLGLFPELANDPAGMKQLIINSSQPSEGLNGIIGDPAIIASNIPAQ